LRRLDNGGIFSPRLVHLSDYLEARVPIDIKPDFGVVRRNKIYGEVAKQIEGLILKN
jgi:hypothetical protein